MFVERWSKFAVDIVSGDYQPSVLDTATYNFTPITNIRGSLYDNAGNVVGDANPVLVEELAAKSHVWRNRDQLSDLIGNTWNGTASLKIDNAGSNLRLLNLNFINSETFFNFSCYETGQ